MQIICKMYGKAKETFLQMWLVWGKLFVSAQNIHMSLLKFIASIETCIGWSVKYSCYPRLLNRFITIRL